MGRCGTVGTLGVLHFLNVADILCYMATKSHGKRLDAATNTEDRQLAVIGQLGDKQLGEVALAADITKLGRRLLTYPKGIVVATATEDETIETAEGIENHVRIADGRDYHRHAPGSYD
jgi:hypothetical protein